MRALLLTPERSVGLSYEDDRYKERYAINIRHRHTTEILRFRTFDEVTQARRDFKRQGYKLLRKR